ncbi:hypothetical protein MKW94_014769 [Papaver nudicaule]|uniref:Uncharacterized protein n=1 Tax=Papaver nudicaule TaxID=74823 RepID=A0AA41RTZ7_PAPNU|nr:hypothetical protein [Papaver nudicaule]
MTTSEKTPAPINKEKFRRILRKHIEVEVEEPLPDLKNMSRDELDKYLKDELARTNKKWAEKQEEERQKFWTPAEVQLEEKQKRDIKRRQDNQAREIKEYMKNNRFNKKSFISDIESGSYDVYVFCFGYAKLESAQYKKFIKSLSEDNAYKVYIHKSLGKIVGMAPKGGNVLKPGDRGYEKPGDTLKPGDRGYKTIELEDGLHKIGIMLDADDVAVLLAGKTKTKDEVLSKFREYVEYDFVKPGNTPQETLAFARGDVLTLPPRSKAMELCPKLMELGMPVELIGLHNIKLTDTFIVCEETRRVSENGSKILRLLEKKMFKYILVPQGRWSADSKKTEYFPMVDRPKSR